MAYVLDAFIGPADILKQQMLQLPNSKLILLTQGLAMAPMLYEDRRAVDLPDTVEPFWHLPDELFQLGAKLSTIGPIGYFEIEFWGGMGEQVSVMWRDGQTAFGPHKTVHETGYEKAYAINDLLKHLGVQPNGGSDEFEAVGFPRYRSNEDWLASG